MADIVSLSDTTMPREPVIAGEIATKQYVDQQTPAGSFPPAGQGYIAWTLDPAVSGGGHIIGSGTIYFRRWRLAAAASIASISVFIDTAPTSQTGGGGALYDDAGNLLVSKAETTLFNSIGLKVCTFAAPVALDPGFYWGAFLFIGTAGSCALGGAGSGAASAVGNIGSSPRLLQLTGQTGFPASVDFGTMTLSTTVSFMGFK